MAEKTNLVVTDPLFFFLQKPKIEFGITWQASTIVLQSINILISRLIIGNFLFKSEENNASKCTKLVESDGEVDLLVSVTWKSPGN